jgi:hypothetical protein
MPHLIALGLPIIPSVAHLLKVVLVLLQTSLGDMPLTCGHLLTLISLSAYGKHPVVALLTRVIVVVVLNIYLVVHVVHVLLL